MGVLETGGFVSTGSSYFSDLGFIVLRIKMGVAPCAASSNLLTRDWKI